MKKMHLGEVATKFIDDLHDSGRTDADIENMSPEELCRAWLEWEGIIGYYELLNRLFISSRSAYHD